MKKVFIGLMVLASSSAFAGGFYCDPNTANLKNSNGSVLWGFAEQSSCREFLKVGVKSDFYCDPSTADLKNSAGKILWNFEHQASCREFLNGDGVK